MELTPDGQPVQPAAAIDYATEAAAAVDMFAGLVTGYAPATVLQIESPAAKAATLVADLLTYSGNQTVTVELNGCPVGQLAFTRTNQRERLTVPLALRAGRNELRLHYSQSLVTGHDPRQLAAIFLGLRILAASDNRT